MEQTTLEQAKNMTREELVQLGRFNMKLLARQAGLTAYEEERVAFTGMGNVEQAAFLFDVLHNKHFPQKWANEPWVAELFIQHPELLALSERPQSTAGFNFCFIVSARTIDGEELHHLVEAIDFSKDRVVQLLGRLAEDHPGHGTRWMDNNFFARNVSNIILSVTREKLDIPTLAEPVPLMDDAAYQAEFRDVMRTHGGWMLQAMKACPNITLFGRRANKVVSPNTYLIQLTSEGKLESTWMKYPDLAKIRHRVTRERNRWKHSTAADLQECRLFVTRETVFRHFGEADPAVVQEERIANGYERRQPSKAAIDATVKEMAKTCPGCGCSLETNAAFGEERECGECTVKRAGDFAWLEYKFGPKAFPERMPKKVRDARFDPRPGIDDQGQGFYSPTWED